MFERLQHRSIEDLLVELDGERLRAAHCYFGGGTAMFMRFGEWRVSSDIDFMVSDWAGYKAIRAQIVERGIGVVGALDPLREVIADRYGIRTLVTSGTGPIKFEIVHEGRIAFDPPSQGDEVCGITTLSVGDMVASTLLANDDRWADRALFSRDVVDLAMLPADAAQWSAGRGKAVGAYGPSVDKNLARAVDDLLTRSGWLATCMRELQIETVTDENLRARLADLRAR